MPPTRLHPAVHAALRALTACACALGLQACAGGGDATDERARALSQRFLIVDTHIDVPDRIHGNDIDVTVATDGGDFDYPRAAAGGLDVVFMSIYIAAEVDAAGEAGARADALIDSVEAIAMAAPEKFALATCVADVRAIEDSGRIALALGMENGGPIAGSFEALERYRDRGIRYVTLAHSKSNHISDSSYDTDERWQGLSPFGRALVEQMNNQGVMVDVSHVSDRAFWQVLELTKVPVIASHSSLRHFTPGFQRNMSDDMVAALGRNGGVIQINFGSSFLTEAAQGYGGQAREAAEAYAQSMGLTEDDPMLVKFLADYRTTHPYPYATVDDVLDHIDRAVALAGIDHVGLGSDYDGVGDSLPIGLKDVSQYPNLVAGMLRRGHSEVDIEKILGGNLLRVWETVERYAAAWGNPPRCSQT